MHSNYFCYLLLVAFVCFHGRLCQGQKFFSKAKLHPKCKPIRPTKELNMEWAMTIFAGKAFYIPLGSATALEDLSHMLSGNKPSSENELDDMCAKVKIKAFKSVIEGYDGRFLVVDCPMISKGMQDCSPSPNTEDPARHKDAKAIQTLAWTDNKENIVLVRCTPDGKRNDWLLYTTNVTLDEETKTSVLNKMQSLGFDVGDTTREIRSPAYDKCVFNDNDDDDI